MAKTNTNFGKLDIKNKESIEEMERKLLEKYNTSKEKSKINPKTSNIPA